MLHIACLVTFAVFIEGIVGDDNMACQYGERGSLTVYCKNATAYFFKMSSYRFDHLDETMKCVNCKLKMLEAGTFDLPGNQIKILDLTSSSITEISQKAFVGLIFMQKLILSDNPIEVIQPGAFIGIRKVEILLIQNAVSSLEPYVFQELHLLDSLYLNNNNLTDLPEEIFVGLYNLRFLDLSENQLLTLKSIFNPLIRLSVLYLHHNSINNITGNEFSNLKKLRMLNLQNNLITNFTMNIDHFNDLRLLNLSSNRLSNDIVKIGSFKNLWNLEILDLSLNLFKNIPNKFFEGLYHLRLLNLYENRIKSILTGCFSGLPQLETLNVSGNELESAIVSGRLQLYNLHTLDLSHNFLKDFDFVSFIDRTPKITFLNLLDNKLPCDKVYQIETLFENENIAFLVSNDDHPAEKCNGPRQTAKEIVKELIRERTESKSNTTLAMMFLLFTVIVILIGALFYIQFFIILKIQRQSTKIFIS